MKRAITSFLTLPNLLPKSILLGKLKFSPILTQTNLGIDEVVDTVNVSDSEDTLRRLSYLRSRNCLLAVSPNPCCDGVFNVEFDAEFNGGAGRLEVIDVLGRVKLALDVSSRESFSVKVNGLEIGHYVVRILYPHLVCYAKLRIQ